VIDARSVKTAIHVLHPPDHAGESVADTERDAEEHTRIIPDRDPPRPRLRLHPAVNEALGTLTGTDGQAHPVPPAPITDSAFHWHQEWSEPVSAFRPADVRGGAVALSA
jgi:hypothetical protein